MDKEIIELLKTVAGSTETLVIWYFILNFISGIVNWIGFAFVGYWVGRGAKGLMSVLN